ncbi:NUDIX hydrolase [Streptomyces sp. H27-D2]|uniref:NUDIX hydrolase n=1 Tax=Streptomyces sp. H27-D2 TaxID=3046304 RepID=UPI002DB9E3A3|nr:NUDIX domain-containing protein [Streptomyces sp. H27-D2]MEC4018574.1 NUDIX domain-containing protein [Streptomyces sp. H27-D2]
MADDRADHGADGTAADDGAGGAPDVRGTPPRSADELLDIVDERDRVVGQARRGDATTRRLRHRCAFILARDAEGRTFVHRRTAQKLVFPSLYDMFVGGVVGAGESYDEAALREAEEELGVSGLPAPTPLFSFLYETPEHTWWSRVYEVECTLPVDPQREEVAWHAFLTEAELEQRLTEWEWVPDGLAAYERLRAVRAAEGRAGPRAAGPRAADREGGPGPAS